MPRPASAPSSASPARGPDAAASLATLLLAAGLLLAVLAAYLPALRGGFIWNDAEYVTAPHLRGWDGLGAIWTAPGATEQYYPLLHTAFWLEHRLWGDWPAGYHLTSIVQHALAALFFALVLRRLAVPGAWLAAFIFALHPVAVESVAWISEQKNTLSAALGLAAAWAYLRFDGGRRGRDYILASVLFLAALLSKSTAAVIPPALLVALWWRRGRLDGRGDVLPLLPWLAAGAGFGLFTAWVERRFIGADGPEFALDAAQRLLLAGRIPWFYLGKLAWPADLVFIYPRWTVDAGAAWQWLFPAATAAVVAACFRLRDRTRAPLATALLFGGMLFPVLGFLNVYAFIYSFVADHWQYLPMLAPIALAAALLSRGLAPLPGAARGAVILGLLAVLATLSWRQCGRYRDLETFYRELIAANPACWMAHHNLATLLRETGRRDEARTHLEEALALRPELPRTLHSLAIIAREDGQRERALELDRRAVALDPGSAKAHDHLGVILRELGRPAEALRHHERALELDPGSADAWNHAGMTLRDLGRDEDALRRFDRALALSPGLVAARLNLALTLSRIGRGDEAMEHYREARRLDPRLPDPEAAAPR
ncbi:MAG TPA: tetratricopeptide repeat protein [Opitutaceae bacterium]|nr:tetratricopeptide repeat protein [Opitutaceae bacterium]